MLTRKNYQLGATLIELMIGLAIFAILLAVSGQNFRIWIINTQIRNGAEAIQNGMQIARNAAIQRNTKVEFRLDADGGGNYGSGWTVAVAATNDVIQTRDAQEGSRNVVLTITPAGASKLTFSALGRVEANADGSAPITRVDIDVPTSVLSAADSRKMRILTARSQIRMCDPSVSATDDPRHC